jgi:hypothetical protein
MALFRRGWTEKGQCNFIFNIAKVFLYLVQIDPLELPREREKKITGDGFEIVISGQRTAWSYGVHASLVPPGGCSMQDRPRYHRIPLKMGREKKNAILGVSRPKIQDFL